MQENEVTVKQPCPAGQPSRRNGIWGRIGVAALIASTTLVAIGALSGCGGSTVPGENTQATTAYTGRATFSVRWPERTDTRLVPFAAESVRVRLVRGTALLGEAVLIRPASGGSVITTFNRLAPGPVQVQAAAYPTATGDGVAQARAEVSVVIQAGQTTATRLTMQSTIDHVEITPALTTLSVGQKITLAATARNAAGEVVLTNSSTLQWTSNTPSLVAVEAGGLVTGLAAGQGSVAVTETESGLSATLGFAVNSGTGGTGGNDTPPPALLALKINDLAYSPATGRMYATIGSSVANGNSLAVINPLTGTVEKNTFIGSEPGGVAVSDDGRYAYAILSGSGTVARYDTVSNQKDLEFGVGTGLSAEQLEVMPGNGRTVAIARQNRSYSPRNAGTYIYDDGVARPNGVGGPTQIEWATPTRIYGYNSEISSFDFVLMTVDSNGATWTDGTGSLISNYNVEITYDGGRLFTSNGAVIDPENKKLLGSVAGRGILAADMAHNRVFFTHESGNGSDYTVTIDAYDTGTFLKVGETPVKGVVGYATHLVRWGDRGIAFTTSEGRLYLLSQAPTL